MLGTRCTALLDTAQATTAYLAKQLNICPVLSTNALIHASILQLADSMT